MLYLAQHSPSHSADLQSALRAIDGYLFLGLDQDALTELDGIHIGQQGNTAVLRARVRVLLHLKRWAVAERLAERCAAAFPAIEEFTVQRAFALQQLKKGDEAMDAILAAPEWIRRTGIIHYNLACYEARLGDLSMARRCIDVAIQMNGAMKRNARVDPDLQALHN